MYFNVFEAAPENERDGPSQQATQNAGGKVRIPARNDDYMTESSILLSSQNIFCSFTQGHKLDNSMNFYEHDYNVDWSIRWKCNSR